MILLKILLIFHTLGDFYFQSNKLCDLKKNKISYLIIHVSIYTIFFVPLFWISTNILAVSLLLFGVFITHFVCDLTMSRMNKGNKDTLLLLIDQIVHVLIILIVWFVLKDEVVEFVFLDQVINQIGVPLSFDKLVSVFLITLIILKPTSILIEKSLPVEADNKAGTNAVLTNDKIVETDQKDKPIAIEQEQERKINYGSIIGKLERIIIVILAFLNLWPSIALVFTAKSIARFKQLEDKSFAQKYLIGTLLSLTITLLTLLLFWY